VSQETDEVQRIFGQMLAMATGDGSKKRSAGLKPKWTVDPSHEAALFSHLNKWKHGEKKDPDSGAHPLVHLAWRALAIAWQETNAEGAEPFQAQLLEDSVRQQILEAYMGPISYKGKGHACHLSETECREIHLGRADYSTHH
jgi:hypothetical protein